MEFARKILGKYGWKDGEGLGKNNNGIAKPLRATLKFDNAGFGADQAASDFNNHWWERVFNDAASNVEIKQDGETIKMDLVDNEDGVEITTKGYSVKKLKKAKKSRESITDQKSESTYNNFLQAATLSYTGFEIVNPDRIEVGDIEVTKVKVLTDEELFKACGGRTAHKGARHGLKLSGKLARIEKQEEELLAKMIAKRNGVAEEQGLKVKVEKKTKENTDTTKEYGAETPSNEHKETRKQEKKNRKLTSTESVASAPQEFKEKKKKNDVAEEDNHEADNRNCDSNGPTSENKSKKMKNKHQDSNITEVTTNLDNVLTLKSKKLIAEGNGVAEEQGLKIKVKKKTEVTDTTKEYGVETPSTEHKETKKQKKKKPRVTSTESVASAPQEFKKKNDVADEDNHEADNQNCDSNGPTSETIISKKMKNKHQDSNITEVTTNLDDVLTLKSKKTIAKRNGVAEEQGLKIKVKKKKEENTDTTKEYGVETPSNEHKETRKQEKKKRKLTSTKSVASAPQEFKEKKNDLAEEDNHEADNRNCDGNDPTTETKCKKMKNKHQDSNITEVTTNLDDVLTLKSKKTIAKRNGVAEEKGLKIKVTKKKEENTDTTKEYRVETPSNEHKETRKQEKKKRKHTPSESVASTTQEFKKKNDVAEEDNHETDNKNCDGNDPTTETKCKKMKNKHQDSNISEVTTNLYDVLTPKSKKNRCVVHKAAEDIPSVNTK